MLSLEQKLYQFIIHRLDGDSLGSQAYRDSIYELIEKGIGGFILFGGEIDRVRTFIRELQASAETPLLMASDIERGVGQQIEDSTIFPSQMAVASALHRRDEDDEKVLSEMVVAIADEAADAGINMPLIPVLDVNTNPENPIICTRAFSDDPQTVSWYGSRYVNILESKGLISCAKHFPGHGDTAIDSHLSLPVIRRRGQSLHEVDLYPFSQAIRAGVSSIMIGHLHVPAIDSLPASLSRKIMTDLLRRDLSFEGLIVTDALTMHALDGVKQAPLQCLNGGADLLLHPDKPQDVVRELKEAVTAGLLKEKTLDTALERVLHYKSGLPSMTTNSVSSGEHSKIARTLFEKSIVLVKGSEEVVPVREQRLLVITVGTEDEGNFPFLKRIMPDGSRCMRLQEFIGTERDALLSVCDTLVFTLFTNIAAWKGSSGLRDRERSVIQEIINAGPPSIVISFGSPYELAHFHRASVLVAACDTSRSSQAAAVNCLTGRTAFTGRLPVTITAV